jgi:hypothetical protein
VPVNATVDELDNIPLSEVQGFKEPALPWYSDQALPFDITVAAANEYGAAASAKLFGVEILNEGFGSSVDDSVLEMQATFVARSVAPLQAVGRLNLVSCNPLFSRNSESPGVTPVPKAIPPSRVWTFAPQLHRGPSASRLPKTMILRSADEHREKTTRAGLARGQSRRAAGFSCRLSDGAKQHFAGWVRGRGTEEENDEHPGWR